MLVPKNFPFRSQEQSHKECPHKKNDRIFAHHAKSKPDPGNIQPPNLLRPQISDHSIRHQCTKEHLQKIWLEYKMDMHEIAEYKRQEPDHQGPPATADQED